MGRWKLGKWKAVKRKSRIAEKLEIGPAQKAGELESGKAGMCYGRMWESGTVHGGKVGKWDFEKLGKEEGSGGVRELTLLRVKFPREQLGKFCITSW